MKAKRTKEESPGQHWSCL